MKLQYKFILNAVLLTGTLSSCSDANSITPDEANTAVVKHVKHHNITIALDLSNRILPNKAKPIHDTTLLFRFINNLEDQVIYSGNRLVNQKDVLRIRSINKKYAQTVYANNENLGFDLNRFEYEQQKRVNFIKLGGLDSVKQSMKSELQKLYKTSRNQGSIYGADIFSYLKSVDAKMLNTSVDTIKDRKKAMVHTYDNILVFVTDGYIEFGTNECSTTDKVCPSLSQSRVSQFRRAFKASGATDMQLFFNNGGYGITPVQNKHLKGLKVAVIEVQDRSLVNGNSRYTPSDFEIMRLFWTDWLVNSGIAAQDIKFQEATDNAQECLNSLLKF